MSRIVWACWDGGGNLTPSLGIAAELTERGHTVHFFGRDEMVNRVEAAGLPATALSQARTDLDRYSFHPLPTVFGYTIKTAPPLPPAPSNNCSNARRTAPLMHAGPSASGLADQVVAFCDVGGTTSSLGVGRGGGREVAAELVEMPADRVPAVPLAEHLA
jgi:hypothetical protein